MSHKEQGNLDKEYQRALEEFKKMTDEELLDEWDSKEYLLNENSFENPMDRMTAERIIEGRQGVSLDSLGGYPLWDEVSFIVKGVEYSVIAYGASGENEGEDALFGMIFIKENEQSKKMREWGRNSTERNWTRFNKYLDEVRKGVREPTGEDEFGKVPYICEGCKKAQATVYSPKGELCKECDRKSLKKSNRRRAIETSTGRTKGRRTTRF